MVTTRNCSSDLAEKEARPDRDVARASRQRPGHQQDRHQRADDAKAEVDEKSFDPICFMHGSAPSREAETRYCRGLEQGRWFSDLCRSAEDAKERRTEHAWMRVLAIHVGSIELREHLQLFQRRDRRPPQLRFKLIVNVDLAVEVFGQLGRLGFSLTLLVQRIDFRAQALPRREQIRERVTFKLDPLLAWLSIFDQVVNSLDHVFASHGWG